MQNLYNKLVEYSKSDFYPFHMPGHKRNMYSDINLYDIDITEIDGFDNLHDEKGIIDDVEKRLTRLYKTRKSFMMVNGSTGGLLSAISSSVNIGDTILIARNCHKSVYNAAFLNRLNLEYVYPEVLEGFNICGAINSYDIEKKLKENPDIMLVVITSPTYEGVVSDIDKIADIVHRYNKILIVDEAHGAHLKFDNYFPKSALECNADIVVQSLHKTLPALTQSAVIHINSDRVDINNVKNYLSIYQTSSPSYIIMSGIDRCISMLEEDKGIFGKYIEQLNSLRMKLSKLDNLTLLETKNYDKSKIVIFSNKIYGSEIYKLLLTKYHLQMEMASQSYIIAMTSLMDTEEGFNRLQKSLIDIDKSLCNLPNLNINNIVSMKDIIMQTKMNIYDAYHSKYNQVSLKESIGKISSGYIYLYPPGIPLIVPGEQISERIIKNIYSYINSGLDICGIKGPNKTIKVVN